MVLKDNLEKFTKEYLLNQARSLGIKKCSGLRKADLIDRIVEVFISEEMIRSRVVCLTEEQMDLFRKACEKTQEISIREVVDSMLLCRYWLGTFEPVSDRFLIFEEVAAIFKKIDNESFREEQYKKGWLMKCVQFFINYYGIAPIEVLFDLYKLKVEDTIEEMIEMLWGMPMDIVESCIFPMECLGLQEWLKNDPMYSKRGLFIHIPILDNHEFGTLLDLQRGKSFYIPSVQQIEELSQIGYEESSLAYEKLKKFFMTEMEMSYEKAVSWCLQVWANGQEGALPTRVIDKMSSAGVSFGNKEMINKFLELLKDACNDTRLKANRGHKPKELGKKEVYPNDLCPCGSGKKYKKCCGRQ